VCSSDLNKSNILIEHIGYDINTNLKKEKAKRNLELLIQEYRKSKNPYLEFQLALTHEILENYSEAKKYFLLAAENKSFNTLYRAHSYTSLSVIFNNEHNINEACRFLEKSLLIRDNDAFTHLLAAKVYLRRNDIKKATINTATEITKISYDGKQYHIIDAHGNTCLVDHIIVATNALQAVNMLKNIGHAQDVMSILSKIEYIQAFLAVHNDLRFLPKKRSDWSVSNIMYDGTFSTLTIYKKWKYQVPFLRSWLLPTFEKPQDIIALEEYYHAKPTPAYFNVQNVLKPLQGKNNLWFAGIYTMGIDSHESALASAIPIACALKPDAQRLKLLL